MFEMAPHVIIFVDGKQGEGIRYQGSILKLKSISSLCLPPSDVAYFQTLGDDDSFLFHVPVPPLSPCIKLS